MALTQVQSGMVASGAVTVSNISATGTPSSSTYLRGDGAWNAISAGPTATNYYSIAGVSSTSVNVPSTATVIYINVMACYLTSGSILARINNVASGYEGVCSFAGGTNASGAQTSTIGFVAYNQGSRYNYYTFILSYMGNGRWGSTCAGGNINYPGSGGGGSWGNIGGTATSVQVLSSGGTAFTSGYISVLYA